MQHNPRYLLPILLSALMIIPAGVGAAVTQDDAGSGGDAGDTQDDALILPGPGTYDGAFGVNDPADWYRLQNENTEDVHCTLLDVSSHDGATDVTMEANGHRVTGQATEDRPLHVSLASPFVAHIDYGFEPHKASMLDSGLREYSFTTDTLSVWELADLKDKGDDAPERPGGGPLPDDCAFGQLGNGDKSDTFTFDALAGDSFVFSLADTGGQEITMTVIDPAGNIIDSGLDSLLGTEIDTSGTWSIELSVRSGTTVYYLLGSCDPLCFIDIQG